MRQVSFRLRLFQSERERASSERILRVLLRALAAADVEYLRAHPNTPPLYQAGVRYRAERVPREFWKGVAETLDWARALQALGADELDDDLARATLGSVLKFHEDQQRVGDVDLAAAAAGS